MIRLDGLAQLRAERDAEGVAARAALDQYCARLQAMHDLGHLLAAEQFSYAQVREISRARNLFYRAPCLVPGLSAQTPEGWHAFVQGVAEVGALV
jgi:hypothetical protein